MSEPIEDAYFNWLYAKVAWHDVRTPSTSYQSLLYLLHTTEFVWLVAGDDNRAQDGLELRRDFLRESGYSDHTDTWMQIGCSVLEMLVAFSKRTEFQTVEYNAQAWFWKFLENLGLSDISDGTYTQEHHRIGPVLNAMVWRRYDQFGRRGGIFPLRNSPNDQRQVEIWYQFCEFIVENDIS